MPIDSTDTAMSSTATSHTATWRADRNMWEVSYLPGMDLDRNQATTALKLAEAISAPETHPRLSAHQHEQLCSTWASELGLTVTEVRAKL